MHYVDFGPLRERLNRTADFAALAAESGSGREAEAAADNLRSQMKGYLDDNAKARQEAENARREAAQLRRELEQLRGQAKR